MRAFKIILLLAGFVALGSTNCFSQQILWSKTFGGSRYDRITSINGSYDGGYIVLGSSRSRNGDMAGVTLDSNYYTPVIYNIDQDGNILWRFVDTTLYDGSSGFYNSFRTLNLVHGDGNTYLYNALGRLFDPELNSGLNRMHVGRLNKNGVTMGTKMVYLFYLDNMYQGMDISDIQGRGFTLIGRNGGMLEAGYIGLIYNPPTDSFAFELSPYKYGAYPKQLLPTSDGGYISFGYYNHFGCCNFVSFCNTECCQTRNFAMKYSATGTLQWTRCYTNFSPIGRVIYAERTKVDQYRFITRTSWVVNVNSNGDILSSHNLGQGTIDTIRPTPDGGFVIAKNIVANSACSVNGGADIQIIKTDANGLTEWTKCLGGSNNDYVQSVYGDKDGNILVAGYTYSNDGDVVGNRGSPDMWIVKIAPKVNSVFGRIFYDYNKNGVEDPGEPIANSVLGTTAGPAIKVSSSLRSDGWFRNNVLEGSYGTQPQLLKPYYTSSPAIANSSFTGYNNFDTVRFALQSIDGKKDIRVNLVPLDRARRNDYTRYRLSYVNDGTVNIDSLTVVFIKDSSSQLLTTFPFYSSISGDTVIWQLGSLPKLDSGSILINIRQGSNVSNGYNLQMKAEGLPVLGDETPADNEASLVHTVTGSYDPNDKNETHGNGYTIDQLYTGEFLDYTIRFQNVGTDTAFRVEIRDTLDNKLDASTLQMLGSSHNYRLEIKNGKYCTWRFDDIKLVDSSTNEPLSHGYISYRIRPASNVLLRDSIRNSASIYFDFNLPVKTNTTLTVVNPGQPPATPIVTGLLTSYCKNAGIQRGKIGNPPTSGIGVNMTVKLDSLVLPVAEDSTFNFDVGNLTPGNHKITVTYLNPSGESIFIHDFVLYALQTPDVNLIADTALVINAEPVLLTAVHVTGGGLNPLYTFAKDRNISNILQSEGASNTFNLNPATLAEGDNWIFVRMKTSASCYSIQTDIDSVKLTFVLAPEQPVVTDLNNSYCNNAGVQTGKIVNLPANNGITTTLVKLDTSVLNVLADGSFSFPVTTLAVGLHTITVTFSNAAGSKTTSHSFTNLLTVSPELDLSANTTVITNLALPVQVTVSLVSGQGTNPLYTFARDRNFANLIQAESGATTVTINPADLALGDNWIYGRMRSNAPCVTSQTSIDSIKLIRDMSTGISDPDNPGKIINLFPNPFTKQLYVKGLDASKIYTIYISNINGQVISQKRVSQQANAELNIGVQKPGTYLVSIYDERRKLLLGSVKLVKK